MEPWLLEVNLSPACEERTEWMTKYISEMAEGMLRIVLPSYLLPKSDEVYFNHWKELIIQNSPSTLPSHRSTIEPPTSPRAVQLVRRLQLRYRILAA